MDISGGIEKKRKDSDIILTSLKFGFRLKSGNSRQRAPESRVYFTHSVRSKIQCLRSEPVPTRLQEK